MDENQNLGLLAQYLIIKRWWNAKGLFINSGNRWINML